MRCYRWSEIQRTLGWNPITQSFKEICENLFVKDVEHSESLRLLQSCELQNSTKGMQTWLTNWSIQGALLGCNEVAPPVSQRRMFVFLEREYYRSKVCKGRLFIKSMLYIFKTA